MAITKVTSLMKRESKCNHNHYLFIIIYLFFDFSTDEFCLAINLISVTKMSIGGLFHFLSMSCHQNDCQANDLCSQANGDI